MNIKINNLYFKYSKNTNYILNNISLNIKEKRVNIFLGINGSGKTTLIKLLAGLLHPLSGSIFYNDKNIKQISILKRSQIFSYVPQKVNVDNSLLVYDYLTFSLSNKTKFYSEPTTMDKEKIMTIARKLKMDKLLFKNMGAISGGEKQLTALASALIQDSDVIILDEPTSYLDLTNQKKFLDYIKQISKNKTIILSTHNPNHALFLNAYVYLINDNKVSDYGEAIDLINPNKLKTIYGNDICLAKELDYEEISFK